MRDVPSLCSLLTSCEFLVSFLMAQESHLHRAMYLRARTHDSSCCALHRALFSGDLGVLQLDTTPRTDAQSDALVCSEITCCLTGSYYSHKPRSFTNIAVLRQGDSTCDMQCAMQFIPLNGKMTNQSACFAPYKFHPTQETATKTVPGFEGRLAHPARKQNGQVRVHTTVVESALSFPKQKDRRIWNRK